MCTSSGGVIVRLPAVLISAGRVHVIPCTTRQGGAEADESALLVPLFLYCVVALALKGCELAQKVQAELSGRIFRAWNVFAAGWYLCPLRKHTCSMWQF